MEEKEREETELCPICGVREVEIDDLGYYGCNKCFYWPSQDVRDRVLDQDLTGQDWENYG